MLRIIYNTKRRSRFFWTLRKGDETLSLQYPLDRDSVVFDIGAYTGQFTDKILLKFKCNIYAFEPVKNFVDILKNKFEGNQKVNIFNFGLLDKYTGFQFGTLHNQFLHHNLNRSQTYQHLLKQIKVNLWIPNTHEHNKSYHKLPCFLG